MATTLSYGFVKPGTGDRGSVFFPALEGNIQKLNDHNHDGANSALLSPASFSITGYTVGITSGTWTDLTNGNYSKVITAPAGVTEVNNYNVYFYDSTGKRLHLRAERASATSMTVYINQDISITAVFR